MRTEIVHAPRMGGGVPGRPAGMAQGRALAWAWGHFLEVRILGLGLRGVWGTHWGCTGRGHSDRGSRNKGVCVRSYVQSWATGVSLQPGAPGPPELRLGYICLRVWALCQPTPTEAEFLGTGRALVFKNSLANF